MPDGIPVRQAGNLPPAFFRFLLTGDTLAIGYVLDAITCTWDFHPLENVHTERTTKNGMKPSRSLIYKNYQNYSVYSSVSEEVSAAISISYIPLFNVATNKLFTLFS